MRRMLVHRMIMSTWLAFAPTFAFAQRGPAVVEVSPISRREISATQPTLGSVVPTRRAVIGSAVDGRVVKFLVRQGDRVEKDQELASLLTATIELELEAAEAELEQEVEADIGAVHRRADP